MGKRPRLDCSWFSSWSESILRATINSESEPQLFDADAVALQLPGLLAEDESGDAVKYSIRAFLQVRRSG
ncbi:hypothetical protein GCM10017710_15950 [Arthrobacter ramosus]